jgi:hypothetical protein
MTFTISGTQPEASISGNSLPELVSQAQELLLQIRQHPQFKGLRFDCDVAFGDVKQYFNYLEWAANADSEVSQYGSDKHFSLSLGSGERVRGKGERMYSKPFPFPLYPLTEPYWEVSRFEGFTEWQLTLEKI